MHRLHNPMDIDSAVERASKWVEAVAPVILTVRDLDNHYFRLLYEDSDGFVTMDARDIVNDALGKLRKLVENVRDEFIQSEHPKCPSNDEDDDAWNALEAFVDELDDRVPSVAAAYKIALEDN